MKVVGGITGEGIFWTIALCCATLIAMVVILGGHGCNQAASVKCKDGTTYTQEAFVEEPDLTLGEAKDFCRDHGGVGSFTE